MTSRWHGRHHPLAVTSASAEYDAVLAHMAALGQYHPAGPTDDNPADWWAPAPGTGYQRARDLHTEAHRHLTEAH